MSSESRFGVESTPCPGLYLLPLDDSFYPPKRIPLAHGRVRIGRQLNQKTAPAEGNGVFESRVLSRQHAEAWVEGDRILIRDVKSSNGTFVNGERLSVEGQESEPYELRSDDILEFGIDIIGEQGEVVHRKVAARVTCGLTPADAQRAIRAEQRIYPPAPPAPSSSAFNANTPGSTPGNTPGPLPPAPVQGLFVAPASGPGAPQVGTRRPPHASGLTGMGGMGAEPIRPKSVDFDSILARLRDGPGSLRLPGEREREHEKDARRMESHANGFVGEAPKQNGQSSAAGGEKREEGNNGAEEAKETMAVLRMQLAETQAALARLPMFADAFPGDSAPENESPLMASARDLRQALATLREEVGELHRVQRQRRPARSGTLRAVPRHLGNHKGKGKAKEVKTSSSRNDAVRNGDPKEFWERQDGGPSGEWITDLEIDPTAHVEEGRAHAVEEDRTPQVGYSTPAYVYTLEDGGHTRPDALANPVTQPSFFSAVVSEPESEVTTATLCTQVDVLDKQLVALHERLASLQPTESESGDVDAADASLGALVERVDRLEAQISDVNARQQASRSESAAVELRRKELQQAREREQEEMKKVLCVGLAALQAEFRAFKTEAGALSAPLSMPDAPVPNGYTPLRLGKEYGVYVPDPDAGSEGESSDDRGSSEEEVIQKTSHGRDASGESVTVPGRWRWGLLTPAGSVASRSSVRADGNDSKTSSKNTVVETQMPVLEEPNPFLLAGAVGVGAMLVAAAWWGS
ncbi:hypothetical protein FB45DRAFT_921552 [Roridomyces roridus]|uniref:FHA domain-containing protein n=1 Tax=Roridomyces roridus TaxID=1738132 RepID=A0AAD7FKL7_9AGAR|nr:hypothetical protein FB45DRAFT_921552 [Roridomyces roridus]